MDMPSKLKIVGLNYVLKLNPILRTDDGLSAVGRHVAGASSIEINPSFPKEVQESTLIHEILEAINCNFELALAHHQITTLEHTLYQVLKDNKLYFGE